MPKDFFTVKNEVGKPSEICIYDFIGEDIDDARCIGFNQFQQSFNAIPKGTPINIRFNCKGGSVSDGLAMYNLIRTRRDDTTSIIDGVAFSTGSWVTCAAKKTIMPANGLMLVHKPSQIAAGNSEELRKKANDLDKYQNAIAQIYAEKSGKSVEEMSAIMDQGMLLSGQECLDLGLCDELSNTPAMENKLSDLPLVRKALRKNEPTNAAPNAQALQGAIPMKDKMLALLKKHGVEIANSATEEEILAAVEKLGAKTTTTDTVTNAAIIADINALKASRDAERKQRITETVTNIANEGRIPAASISDWTAKAIADDSVLNMLKALPVNVPGDKPIVQIVGEDVRNIQTAVLNSTGKARTLTLRKEWSRIEPVLNTNTISTDLKRVAILDKALMAFKRRILPCGAFSTVFKGVRLEGTDEVVVPYYPLSTVASTDFSSSYSLGNTTTDAKKVTINKRKYKGISLTSSEFARQPWFDISRQMEVMAERLGYDVFTDILSIVVASSYGVALDTAVAAGNFDVSEVNKIKTTCDTANWPAIGRSMVLSSEYENSLLNDIRFAAQNYGGADQIIKSGSIPQVSGFSVYGCPNIPTNSEKLAGFAVFPSALLVAFSPIPPTAEVRQYMAAYDQVEDPETGLTLEYRRWGNPDSDDTREVIECNYGKLAGEAAALKRIVTP